MKKNLKTIFLIFIIIITVQIAGLAQNLPKPEGAVNDFANVIPSPYKTKIAAICTELWQKTGTAVVVATVPSIGDNYIENYATKLFKKWGIGKKGEDKGVLIILAVKERRVRIETGYGVEGILPDGLTGQILDQYAVPYLRNGDYGNGFLKTVQAVAGIIAKDAKVKLCYVKYVEKKEQDYVK